MTGEDENTLIRGFFLRQTVNGNSLQVGTEELKNCWTTHTGGSGGGIVQDSSLDLLIYRFTSNLYRIEKNSMESKGLSPGLLA